MCPKLKVGIGGSIMTGKKGERRKKVRKVRSDKKRDVKPTVHISLHETISRISYITNQPMKDVAEYLCVRGLNSRKTIELLSTKFRRDYSFKNTVFIGDLEIAPERVVRISGARKRLTIRFTQETHDAIGDLAYALDLTISSTTALLLDVTVKNNDIIESFFAKHIISSLDANRKEQLKEVLRYIKKDNPYASDDEITLGGLISYIIEEMMDYTVNAKKAIERWLDKHIE